MIELKVLQAVRLKGRIAPEDIAATVGEEPAVVADAVRAATEAGSLIEGKTTSTSPEGRARLNELLTAERENADQVAMSDAYDKFRSVNADFKALVADWQLKDGEPNPHDDQDPFRAVCSPDSLTFTSELHPSRQRSRANSPVWQGIRISWRPRWRRFNQGTPPG